MIQCARLAFGFAGIYDQDEAERIAESEGVKAIRQARDPQSASNQNAPDGLDEFEAQHLDSMRAAAMNGEESALSAAFQAFCPQKAAFWQKHQRRPEGCRKQGNRY